VPILAFLVSRSVRRTQSYRALINRSFHVPRCTHKEKNLIAVPAPERRTSRHGSQDMDAKYSACKNDGMQTFCGRGHIAFR
jgi:hypothetical protein